MTQEEKYNLIHDISDQTSLIDIALRIIDRDNDLSKNKAQVGHIQKAIKKIIKIINEL